MNTEAKPTTAHTQTPPQTHLSHRRLQRTPHQTVPYWVCGAHLAWFVGVSVGIWCYISARVGQEMEGPLRRDHPDEAQNRTVNKTVGRLRMACHAEASNSGKALPLWVWRDDATTISRRGPV